MTNRSSNRTAVPEAKGALDKFKYEVANELGVPLSEGYNGDLTSRQNGSVGGYMVNRKNRWQGNNKVTIWDVDLLQRSTSQIAFCPVPN